MEPEPITPHVTESRASARHWQTRYLVVAAGFLLVIGFVVLALALARPAARFPVVMNGRYGYIDQGGKIVVPAQFQEAGHFDEGMAPVQLGGRWGYADKAGKLLIAPQFDVADPFSDGL